MSFDEQNPGMIDAPDWLRHHPGPTWHLTHDLLTGLPNRNSLRQMITHAIHESTKPEDRLALLVVDIDEMHRVNDAAGEEAGDALLVEAAFRVSAAAGGAFVARVGADSFAILLRDEPLRAAAAILETISSPFQSGGMILPITASIGVAEFPHHGSSADHLLRAAHAAVRRAMEFGGNQVQGSSNELATAAAAQLELEMRLRHAIAHEELVLVYQPQVRLEDGAFLGLEALLRWRQADGELLPAERFMHAAERCAVIVDVGEWVIDNACRQLRLWCDAGCAPPRLGLNIGARHFQHPAFLPAMRSAIERHVIDPRMLEIEITETTAMCGTETSIRIITDLRSMGVEVTIDDFGMGYSSLAQLKRFAITGVKIDRSFVHDVPSSQPAAAVIRAILSAAHAHGLRVVAEGVEQPEQAGFLSAAGCDEAQGYWFARPMIVADVEQYVRTRRRE
jgi:diguanylate cyclase (GGDEF)-like protein